MADKTFNLLTKLDLNSDDFKAGVDAVQSNVKKLASGVDGVTGNLGEMKKALQSLRNISFAGKTQEEIMQINKQIGQLTDQMGDLRAVQKGLGQELGTVMAGGLQTLAAMGEVGVGVATMFGASKEQAEKYQRVMVTLIGVTQALGVIEDALATNQFKIIALRIKDTAVIVGQTIATKAATLAHIAFNSVLSVGVFGAITLAVAALTAGLYYLISVTKKNTEAFEKHIKSIKLYNNERIRSKQINEDYNLSVFKLYNSQERYIDSLVTKIKSENTSLNEKKKAIQELINLDPTYLKGLNLSNVATSEGIEYIDKYKEALKQKAQIMAAEAILSEQYTNQFKKQQEIRNAEIGLEVYNIQLRALEKRKERADESGSSVGIKITTDAVIEKNKQIDNQKIKITDLNRELINTNNVIENYTKLIDNNSVSVDFNMAKLTNLSNSTNKNNDDKLSYIETINKQIVKLNEERDALIKQGKSIDVVNAKIMYLKGLIEDYNKSVLDTEKIFILNTYVNDNIDKDLQDQENSMPDIYGNAGYQVDVPEFDTDLIEEQNNQLRNMSDLANISANAISQLGDAFITMAEGGKVSFKSLLMTILGGVRQIIMARLAEAIAGMTAKETSGKGIAGLITAAAGIVGISAIFASLPNFQSGGIIPGDSYSGDKVLVRANSGEGIITKGQQANLFSMLNNTGGLNGGEVRFEIDGSKLVGVLNKYNQKINSYR